MEKRLLLAILISIGVMFSYQIIISKFFPREQVNQAEFSAIKVEGKTEHLNYDTVVPSNDTVVVPIKVGKYEIGILNKGGMITGINILDTNSSHVELVRNDSYKFGILAVEGKGPLSGLSSQEFEIKQHTNSLYKEYNKFKIEKTIRGLKNRYGLECSISITNESDTVHTLSFEVITGSNISEKELYENRYIGVDALYKDGRYRHLISGKIRQDKEWYSNNIEWVALKNKYYSIIAKPMFTTKGIFVKGLLERPVVGFIVDDEKILSGETKIYNFLYYIGPTEISELENVDKSFTSALNFGVFTNIGLILLSVLNFFHRIFNNYGVAILLLTTCVSLVLFPLTFKSLKSMRKLQELQPQMEKLRVVYKDNPPKLNKEIIELYRRSNVNPMGGCLPMFLQMPIFIALYQTLIRAVELKGARFLWIKDLSVPDATFNLPTTLPFFGNAINLLPILMVLVMIGQQKISQMNIESAQTDQQKMMSIMMLVLFGFIFYTMPSGLVLYWVANTIISSSLQFVTLKGRCYGKD